MKNTRQIIKTFLIPVIPFLCLLCGGGSGGDTTRSFHMGFSPWPYDNTQAAVDWVYSGIRADGDIISQHLEEGIPWQEAYDNDATAFSADFRNTINYRVSNSAGKKIVLQINPLNGARDGMALYRDTAVNAPLPTAWQGLSLNDPKVRTAYLNYARIMIDSFNPDYLLLGVEVNLLIRNNPGIWNDYIALHSYVYTALKADYPDLPIGVSVFCVPYFDEWSGPDDTAAQLAGLADLDPCVDFLAFSVHPFMSALLADTFPDDYMRRLFSITSKPVAISESSYPAETWATLSGPALTFHGTPEKQERFLSLMLEQSRRSNSLFVIWFTIRDYDALWSTFDAATQATAITWRDTGLYDAAGAGRPALSTWETWLSRPVSR